MFNFASAFSWKSLYNYKTLLIVLSIIFLYALYINGITKNPPGFYLDESLVSYNAYTIYKTGRGEYGHFLPLYFPIYELPPPHDYLGYLNPVYIYLLAGLYFIFPPSILLSRLLSATAGFLAAFLLGLLAKRISGRRDVGAIVFLTALITPCLFELSRLVMEVALYPLVIILFLLALYNAHLKPRWSFLDNILIGLTLALITYTYSTGRLFGPLMALGLLFFAISFKRLTDVIRTWIVYGITLIPFFIFVIKQPGAISQRFSWLSYITPDKTYWEILSQFAAYYLQCISLKTLLFYGDLNLRHHIPEMGIIYFGTFVLIIIGVIIVFLRHLKNAWWRYILYATLISVVPSALTKDPVHMLRLIPFPIFLLVFTIPAIAWLLDNVEKKSQPNKFFRFALRTSIFRVQIKTIAPQRMSGVLASNWLRKSTLAMLLILTLVQTVVFQMHFYKIGLNRGPWFDQAYPEMLETALAEESRPIYLVDGYWGQAYIHAYWYSTIYGIDLNNFVHVKHGNRPPKGALVISTENENQCGKCEIIVKEDKFLVYWAR
jgi:hypothetical protein